MNHNKLVAGEVGETSGKEKTKPKLRMISLSTVCQMKCRTYFSGQRVSKQAQVLFIEGGMHFTFLNMNLSCGHCAQCTVITQTTARALNIH